MTCPSEETWQLRDPEGRLAIMRRPQGCYDLTLAGEPVAYLTGRGRPVVELLAAGGVAYRVLGDPDGPVDAPTVAPERALADLVAAVDLAGPGCLDAGALLVLTGAVERARALLADRNLIFTSTST